MALLFPANSIQPKQPAYGLRIGQSLAVLLLRRLINDEAYTMLNTIKRRKAVEQNR